MVEYSVINFILIMALCLVSTAPVFRGRLAGDRNRNVIEMFLDAYRFERDYFYDPNMHGVDWAGLKDRYGRLLNDAVTRWDVNFVLGEFIAELNASHTYRGGGDAYSPGRDGYGGNGDAFSPSRPTGGGNDAYSPARHGSQDAYTDPGQPVDNGGAGYGTPYGPPPGDGGAPYGEGPPPAQGSGSHYEQNEIIAAGHGFFGAISQGLGWADPPSRRSHRELTKDETTRPRGRRRKVRIQRDAMPYELVIRMQEEERLKEHGAHYGIVDSVHRWLWGLAAEARLRELDVDVAEVAPEEMVERVAGLVEAERLELRIDLACGRFEAGEDPALRELETPGFEALPDAAALRLAENEAGGVPDLVAERAVAGHPLGIERNVAARAVEQRQREAHRVGAVFADQVLRVEPPR